MEITEGFRNEEIWGGSFRGGTAEQEVETRGTRTISDPNLYTPMSETRVSRERTYGAGELNASRSPISTERVPRRERRTNLQQ